jgi:DNA-binding MarR family transcriptional regulator
VAGSDVSDEQLTEYWHEIVAATGRLHRRLDADLETAGVPPQWYPALDLLLRAPEHRLPMSTLARELTMTSGGFSKLADRMAAEGLIDRRGTTDDRRVVHATLTAAGLELARRARGVYVDALRRRLLSAGDDAGALAATARTLKRLVAAPPDAATDIADHVASERDPALPDRRGRGHESGSDSH